MLEMIIDGHNVCFHDMLWHTSCLFFLNIFVVVQPICIKWKKTSNIIHDMVAPSYLGWLKIHLYCKFTWKSLFSYFFLHFFLHFLACEQKCKLTVHIFNCCMNNIQPQIVHHAMPLLIWNLKNEKIQATVTLQFTPLSHQCRDELRLFTRYGLHNHW